VSTFATLTLRAGSPSLLLGKDVLSGFVLAFLSTDGGGSLFMSVHLVDLESIDLRALDNLDLADCDVLQRVNELAVLGDLVVELLADEVAYNIVDGDLGEFRDEVRVYSCADFAYVGGFSVRLLLDLLRVALGESDDEDTEDIAICSLSINEGLDESLPLANHLEELVTSDVHSVEGGLGCVTINLVYDETDLAPLRALCLVIELREGLLNNAPLDEVSGDSRSRRLRNERLAESARVEGDWSPEVVPLLAGEGVNDLLAVALLAELLVLA